MNKYLLMASSQAMLFHPIHIPCLHAMEHFPSKLSNAWVYPACSFLLSNSNYHITMPDAMDSALTQILLFSNVSLWSADYIYIHAYKT